MHLQLLCKFHLVPREVHVLLVLYTMIEQNFNASHKNVSSSSLVVAKLCTPPVRYLNCSYTNDSDFAKDAAIKGKF